MNCIIIDDDIISRQMLKHCILKTPFLTFLAEFGNPTEAINYINKEKPELIFLDVEMPLMTGIEFLRSMKERPAVIMVSGEKKYAYEGFEQDVVDYLNKPFTYDRFLRAANKAEAARKKEEEIAQDTFLLRTNLSWRKLAYKDVYYAEAMADYVAVYVAEGSGELRRYLVHNTMRYVTALLSKSFFFRVHRSYVVNIHKIEEFSNDVISIGGQQIPVGITFKPKISELYEMFSAK